MKIYSVLISLLFAFSLVSANDQIRITPDWKGDYIASDSKGNERARISPDWQGNLDVSDGRGGSRAKITRDWTFRTVVCPGSISVFLSCLE